jgi:hypothetical protein
MITSTIKTSAAGLILSMIGVFFLFVWALDLVSLPDPAQIPEYSRPAHVWHAAESEDWLSSFSLLLRTRACCAPCYRYISGCERSISSAISCQLIGGRHDPAH